MSNRKVAVVGGGLAGLMATIKAAEAGVKVDLFSIVPVKRSHSVCAQGGINGAVNTKGEGDFIGVWAVATAFINYRHENNPCIRLSSPIFSRAKEVQEKRQNVVPLKRRGAAACQLPEIGFQPCFFPEHGNLL